MTSECLLEVNGVSAWRLVNGEQQPVAELAQLTLWLVYDPVAEGSAAAANAPPAYEERDMCLYLQLPPGLALELPADTRIFQQGDFGYIIHVEGQLFKLDLGTASVEEQDTFQVLLSQYTAFANKDAISEKGRLVLVDEKDGQIVGELADNISVTQSADMTSADKTPVEVILPENANESVQVNPLKDSRIVSSADAVSGGVLFLGDTVSRGLTGAADWYVKQFPSHKRETPLEFKDTTRSHIKRIHEGTTMTARYSAKGVNLMARKAQDAGAKLHWGKEKESTKGTKGLLNKSLVAFGNIMESAEVATKNVMSAGATGATTVVSHRYGPQAAEISNEIGHSARNVGLVFIDAAGVSRRAIVKSVGRGILVGKMKGGGEVVLSRDGAGRQNGAREWNESHVNRQ